VSINNRNSVAYLCLGHSSYKLGEIIKAIQYYIQSIRILPHSLAYNNLGLCLSALRNNLSAIRCWMKSILIDYEYLSSYLNLSDCSQLSSIYR
jgi:tetratricopeptide (TPR) repeat protein